MEVPIEPSQPSRASWAALASAAVLPAGAAFHAAFVLRSSFRVDGQLTFTLFDDAMISLTYARNLAAGDGLVWMAGQPPVEGYTNFLWTLLMALPHLAGLPDRLTALPVMAFGAVLLAVTGVLAMRLARRFSQRSFAPPLALAATVFSYPLAFWTLRGLEVGWLACLVATACLLALRLADGRSTRALAGLCAVLVAAELTRPDAAVIAAAVLGFLALSRRTRRDALVGALAAAGALAAHTAFRFLYYGALLPNTYLLKISGHPLSERAARGGAALWDLVAGTLWLPLGLALAWLLLRRSSLGRSALLLPAVVVAALAYSVYVGGDVWEYAGFANRFISPTLPELFVLAALGIEALLGACAWTRSARARGAAAVAAGLLLIGAANARSFADWVEHGGLHVQDDQVMVRKALAIRAATPADARVAVVWAGAIPYFSRRAAIDLFGKSDPVIARLRPRRDFLPGHDKWDFEYSIGQLRPELVALAWRLSPAEQAQLEGWGYELVAQYYVRRGAEVDRRRLLAPWR